MAPIRVVLDCDTANEVDDQFAIAHALGLPEGVLDVRGVISVHNTTAHGPGSRDMYQDEAERVVSLCGGGVPCITGADRPMNSRDEPVPSSGLEFLIDEARQGPLTVVATGPATDVASLFVADPGLRENVRVVWLGGFGDAEAYGRHKSHELNGRADIAAWRVLFEEDVDLLQVPGWPAPAKILVLAAPFAEEVRAVDSPVASYLAEILELWVAEYGGPVDPGGGEDPLGRGLRRRRRPPGIRNDRTPGPPHPGRRRGPRLLAARPRSRHGGRPGQRAGAAGHDGGARASPRRAAPLIRARPGGVDRCV
ncbi:hypothetical protein BH24ACT18_BH24ACT18_22140 [soil metagenome]|nr:nucleoside hydrolase [Rubrobacter sp.]